MKYPTTLNLIIGHRQLAGRQVAGRLDRRRTVRPPWDRRHLAGISYSRHRPLLTPN
jgi:hypothetical protein